MYSQNYPEDAREAAQYLRQAIPLMMRHDIPPSPVHYALWYTYVRGKDPELNAALDRSVQITGSCSPEKAESLFRKHFLIDEVELVTHQQEIVSNVADGVADGLVHGVKSTENFHKTLLRQRNILAQQQSSETLSNIINVLQTSAEDLMQSQQRLHEKLVCAAKEIDELRHELQETQRVALIDSLTQLNNRLTFDRQLTQLLQQAEPRLSLVLFDIDHFKLFNDQYGHLMGDQVLVTFAKVLQQCCPGQESDVQALCARFGGEEFAVILINADSQAANQYAESVREMVSRVEVRVRNSGKVVEQITVSGGVAECKAGESVTDLIERADAALYCAKRDGRNRMAVAA